MVLVALPIKKEKTLAACVVFGGIGCGSDVACLLLFRGNVPIAFRVVAVAVAVVVAAVNPVRQIYG